MDTPLSIARATDALLIQATLSTAAKAQAVLPQLVEGLLNSLPRMPLQLNAALSHTQTDFYIYVHFDTVRPMQKGVATLLESALRTDWPSLQNVRVSRLEKVFSRDGASAAEPPVLHYVVEMDPETGSMPELSNWYDNEHMPGLASVPGCVRASRFLNHDHGPLSLACYDLLTRETLGSPAWLAVRGTPWSDRMRPKFTNTLRTLFNTWPITLTKTPL